MKSLTAAAVGLLLLGSASVASAAQIKYTTSGVFSGGSTPSTNVLTIGTATLTFSGITAGDVNPGSLSLGELDFDLNGATDLTGTGTFTLTVNQTEPLPGGSDSFGGTVSGTVSFDQSSAIITFASPFPSITIGSVSYQLQTNGQAQVLVVAANNHDGVTSIQGVAAVPVPAAAWSGLGLLGLLGATRVRRMTKA